MFKLFYSLSYKPLIKDISIPEMKNLAFDNKIDLEPTNEITSSTFDYKIIGYNSGPDYESVTLKKGNKEYVVSKGEMLKALKAGISPKKIVFSGVGKTYSGVNGYYYPLFLTAKEAENYDRLQGFSGGSHTHQFSEFPNTIFYMPDGTTRGHGTFNVDRSVYKLWTSTSGPNGVHHYERPQASGDTTKKIITTETTYQLTTSPGVVQTFDSDVITNKQYEENLNESKRRIRILKANLVQEFIDEFERIIGE